MSLYQAEHNRDNVPSYQRKLSALAAAPEPQLSVVEVHYRRGEQAQSGAAGNRRRRHFLDLLLTRARNVSICNEEFAHYLIV